MFWASAYLGLPLTYQQVHQGGVDIVGERCCVVFEFSRHGRSDGVRRVSSSSFLRGKLPPLVIVDVICELMFTSFFAWRVYLGMWEIIPPPHPQPHTNSLSEMFSGSAVSDAGLRRGRC